MLFNDLLFFSKHKTELTKYKNVGIYFGGKQQLIAVTEIIKCEKYEQMYALQLA